MTREQLAPQLHRSITQVDPHLLRYFSKLVDGVAAWPLVLYGPVGTGKTCAALALMDHVVTTPKSWAKRAACYYTVRALCRELIDSWSTRESSAGKVWAAIRSSQIATLDELGAREVSEHHFDAVCEWIDARTNRPAIYITNKTLDEIAKLYDDRVASRLASGTVVSLSGSDRRIGAWSNAGYIGGDA